MQRVKKGAQKRTALKQLTKKYVNEVVPELLKISQQIADKAILAA